MTQEEKLGYLIRELLVESGQYQDIAIPAQPQAKKDLLRALMNVRPPKPIGDDFLKIQDEYLAAERDALGVVDGNALPFLSFPRTAALYCGRGILQRLRWTPL